MDFKAILDYPLFSLAGTKLTVATLALAVIVVIITLIISRLVRRGIKRGFVNRGLKKTGTPDAVGKLVHYILLVIGLSIALQTLGVKLSALFAAGAVFAVGLGFAMQTIVQNFVSGVILLVERAITPGDILEVQGTVVRVAQMKIRSTIVKTLDGEDLVVPNSQLVQAPVKNFTLEEPDYRVRVKVGVVYAADMRLVERCLREVSTGMTWRREDHDPMVFLNDFGNNAVIFEVAVWTNDPWNAPLYKSELNWGIWERFAQEGVVIAFPQVDVHFDEPVVRGLQSLTALSGGKAQAG
ncbi:MAG: mechanosensitive ion channel [Myxococcales bacterium]|nr:mechanosensitive ion channel [Myxococcales bacterium]